MRRALKCLEPHFFKKSEANSAGKNSELGPAEISKLDKDFPSGTHGWCERMCRVAPSVGITVHVGHMTGEGARS